MDAPDGRPEFHFGVGLMVLLYENAYHPKHTRIAHTHVGGALDEGAASILLIRLD